jgi:hypothetical protein
MKGNTGRSHFQIFIYITWLRHRATRTNATVKYDAVFVVVVDQSASFLNFFLFCSF